MPLSLSDYDSADQQTRYRARHAFLIAIALHRSEALVELRDRPDEEGPDERLVRTFQCPAEEILRSMQPSTVPGNVKPSLEGRPSKSRSREPTYREVYESFIREDEGRRKELRKPLVVSHVVRSWQQDWNLQNLWLREWATVARRALNAWPTELIHVVVQRYLLPVTEDTLMPCPPWHRGSHRPFPFEEPTAPIEANYNEGLDAFLLRAHRHFIARKTWWDQHVREGELRPEHAEWLVRYQLPRGSGPLRSSESVPAIAKACGVARQTVEEAIKKAAPLLELPLRTPLKGRPRGAHDKAKRLGRPRK